MRKLRAITGFCITINFHNFNLACVCKQLYPPLFPKDDMPLQKKSTTKQKYESKYNWQDIIKSSTAFDSYVLFQKFITANMILQKMKFKSTTHILHSRKVNWKNHTKSMTYLYHCFTFGNEHEINVRISRLFLLKNKLKSDTTVICIQNHKCKNNDGNSDQDNYIQSFTSLAGSHSKRKSIQRDTNTARWL